MIPITIFNLKFSSFLEERRRGARSVPSLFSQQWIAILDSFVAKWFNGSRPASSSTSVNNARRFALRPRCDKGARFYCEFGRAASPNPPPFLSYFLFSTAPGPAPCRTTSLPTTFDISRCFPFRFFPFWTILFRANKTQRGGLYPNLTKNIQE